RGRSHPGRPAGKDRYAVGRARRASLRARTGPLRGTWACGCPQARDLKLGLLVEETSAILAFTQKVSLLGSSYASLTWGYPPTGQPVLCRSSGRTAGPSVYLSGGYTSYRAPEAC